MRRSARALMLLGALSAVFGLSKLHAAAHTYAFTSSARLGWAFGYVAVLLVAAYAVGLPSLPPSRNRLLVAAGAGALAATLMSFATLVVGSLLLPRLVILGAATLAVPWFTVCARVAQGGREREAARDRVLVVGDSDEGDQLREELAANPERPAVLVGAYGSAMMMGSGDGLPLVDAAVRTGSSVVVLSRRASELEFVIDQAALLHRRGVRIRTLSGFYREWLGKVPIAELERASMLFDIGELHGRRYARLKRILDVGFGSLGLIVFAMLVPFVVVGDLVANRGTLFFRQDRVGRDGRVFTMWKFRTMESGPRSDWTKSGDARITPFGRVLRRTHLDELPQVLNILRGDLSIVGPRPEQPHYVDQLIDKIPFYELRHSVRPGLTGWGQVKFGYTADEGEALEKLQYDFFYLQHQTLGLDVRIVARTVRDVLRAGGR